MRLRPSLVLAAGLLLPAIALEAQQPRRPITHEDVHLAKRLGGLALSPDGRWAVFSVSEPAYRDEDASSDLWVVPADGSAPPRRLTSTRGGEGGAAWSPDGRRIAFTARREGDEVSQVYVLDVAEGGEARRVTALSTGASSPRWRPDGGAILFTSLVYPGAGTDSANRAQAASRRARPWNARVYESFPIRHWDRWLDDRRPSLFVQELASGATARNLLAGSRLVAEPGFGGQLGNSGDELAAAWTPDGRSVVFSATVNRHESAFAEGIGSLYRVEVSGGEPVRLTTENADFGSPRFSADGKTLFATWSVNDGKVYHNNRVVAMAWPDLSGRKVVAGGADYSAQSWHEAAGGGMWFLAETDGIVPLFRAGTNGAARKLEGPGAGAFTGLDVAGPAAAPVLAAVWESAVSPQEVVRIDPASGKTTPLTRFNADRVASIDWQPVRHFWFTSKAGRRIHNMLVLPPAFDATRKYPLFVVIHGGAANMWTDQFVIRWNYHLLGAPGYAILLTNYKGSTGFGEPFAQAIQNDPLNGPGTELLEAVDAALKEFPFLDGSRMAAGGASYGGHLANWLAVNTTRFKALVSHAGLWDLESQWGTSDVMYGRELAMGGPPWANGDSWRKQSPLQKAANLTTPMLVSVGERDYRVPMNNAFELWAALQRMKVPSQLIVWPTENHWVLNGENSRFFYQQVHGWLGRWLGQ
jgi:dipeptidyl aminopeptidase/acylaminoacyl peptidase